MFSNKIPNVHERYPSNYNTSSGFWVLGFDYSNPKSSSPPYIYIYMCVCVCVCVCVCDNLFFGWKIFGVELYIISTVHVYQSFNISSYSYQIVPISYIYTCASFLVILAMSISHLVLLNRIIHLINLLKGEYF